MKRATIASLKRVTPTNLEALGSSRLAALLIAAAEGRPELRRKLRMELAAVQGADHLAAEVDKRLTSLQSSRSKVSWRARPAFVRDVEALRGLIVGRLVELDGPSGLARMWLFMCLAPHLETRVRDKDGALAAVFERCAGDIGGLLAKSDVGMAAVALVDALAEDPKSWRTWLSKVLEGAGPDLAAAALRRMSEQSEASRSWLPLIRLLADASGDVDAFLLTLEPEALRAPSVAAGAARRLLAADRVEQAGDVLRSSAPSSDKPDGEGQGLEPNAEWEGVWIDYLERKGDRNAAQAVRWSGFQRSLSLDRARAFVRCLTDFEDVEAESRALAFASKHVDFPQGLSFLMDWPAISQAATMIQARAEEAALAPELAELWAERLRSRQPAAAGILLRKAAAAAFRRREFATCRRLTEDADALDPG